MKNLKQRLDGTFAPTYPPAGTVAIASQSGALGVAILDYTREFNIGVSDFVSMGNKADVSSNDLVQWWEHDPRTEVILLYLESIKNARAFVSAAKAFTRNKPIIVYKAGRFERSAKAAASHTGALMGADDVHDSIPPLGMAEFGHKPPHPIEAELNAEAVTRFDERQRRVRSLWQT